jgi:dTDP-glucose 4,6-dehydratase
MQRTIFVAGGAGFIGSSFVRYLLATQPDAHVVVFDKLTYAGNLENLTAMSDDARFRFVRGDVCDVAAVRAAMSDCDTVVNFAAETHVDRSIVNPGIFVRSDIEGTYTLLEAARAAKIDRFIQISTDEVYGNAEAPDGTSRPSLETDTLQPLSPYAATKAAADRLAYSYWATYGLPVVLTRCSNNYGPRQHPEKQLPRFITHALADHPLPIHGDGGGIRDWIYVDDHCAALMAILNALATQVVGEVFNIGSDVERTTLQNARMVLAAFDKPGDMLTFEPERLGQVRRHAVNSAKLRALLGWSPRISFEDGIAQTIAWYRANTAWVENVLTRGDAQHDDTPQVPTGGSRSRP